MNPQRSKIIRPRIRQRGNALRLYRTHRLAELLDVNPSTIWKWRKTGVLPEPVHIGSVHGWTESQLEELFAKRLEHDVNDARS
jgi:predicted DNA-binding transcriptional regulator AlpA